MIREVLRPFWEDIRDWVSCDEKGEDEEITEAVGNWVEFIAVLEPTKGEPGKGNE